jgi:hypothetical protein
MPSKVTVYMSDEATVLVDSVKGIYSPFGIVVTRSAAIERLISAGFAALRERPFLQDLARHRAELAELGPQLVAATATGERTAVQQVHAEWAGLLNKITGIRNRLVTALGQAGVAADLDEVIELERSCNAFGEQVRTAYDLVGPA